MYCNGGNQTPSQGGMVALNSAPWDRSTSALQGSGGEMNPSLLVRIRVPRIYVRTTVIPGDPDVGIGSGAGSPGQDHSLPDTRLHQCVTCAERAFHCHCIAARLLRAIPIPREWRRAISSIASAFPDSAAHWDHWIAAASSFWIPRPSR